MALYETLAGATILLLTGYVALLHMAGRFFNRPEMVAQANLELQQLFLSAIIFAIAMGAFEFSNMAANSAGITSAGEDVIDASLGFLHKIINTGLVPAYIDLVSLDIKLSYWSSLSARYGPVVWGFVLKQVAGLEPVINVVRILTFTLTAFFGTLSAQVIIFYAIRALAPLFLSAGVLLRFFPTTRDAGIYLIVFAISFHSFFPFLFALNAHILDEIWLARHGHPYEPYTPLPPDLRGFDIPEDSPSWVAQIIGFFPFVSFFRFALLIPFFEGIASLSLAALFLPALAMSITISFINAVTKFITGKG